MRRTEVMSLAVILAIVLVFSASPTLADWYFEGVDVDAGYGMDMELDSLNRPNISYSCFNQYDTGYVKYAKRINEEGDWDIQIVDQLSTGQIMTSLALDQWDRPHIVYFDWFNNYLKYAHWTSSGGWKIEIVDNSVGNIDSVESPSIAVDSLGRPHVAYYDKLTDSIMYARKTTTSSIIDAMGHGIATVDALEYSTRSNGERNIPYWRINGWIFETVDNNLDLNFYSLPSIAIDSSNKARIAYYAGAYQDEFHLRHAVRLSANNWQIEIVDSDGGLNPSLAIGPDDRSVISYMDGKYIYDNHTLMCARQDDSYPSGWKLELLDQNHRSGADSSIAVDSNNYPHIIHISCVPEAPTAVLKYRHLTPSGWSGEVVTYFEEHSWQSGMVSIALEDNIPHIAYRSWDGDPGSLHILLYARFT